MNFRGVYPQYSEGAHAAAAYQFCTDNVQDIHWVTTEREREETFPACSACDFSFFFFLLFFLALLARGCVFRFCQTDVVDARVMEASVCC